MDRNEARNVAQTKRFEFTLVTLSVFTLISDLVGRWLETSCQEVSGEVDEGQEAVGIEVDAGQEVSGEVENTAPSEDDVEGSVMSGEFL